MSVSRPFRARYEGWCLGCTDEIALGDLICYEDDVVVHERCVRQESEDDDEQAGGII